MTAPIATVNIILVTCGVVRSMIAYPDTPEGNAAALLVFQADCRRLEATEDELADALEGGYYEGPRGNDLYYVHAEDPALSCECTQ